MKKFIFTYLFIGLFILSFSQEKEEKYGLQLNGFVKNDFFYDTRKVEAIREGHFLFYPSNEVFDKEKKNDINAVPNFNFLSIQSRITGKITAPDALGAKTSGMIEAEFFGTSDADINGLRLRHAFVKLDWNKADLLFGQTWNPFFIADCFPDVISFNTGSPFQPFARNPQIRFTYKPGRIELFSAVVSQRDFTGLGPDPTNPEKSRSSSEYLRNSAIPDMYVGIRYKANNEEKKNELIFGAGGEMKYVRPRLKTDSNYIDKTTLQSFAGITYIKIKIKPITFKAEAILGQNLADMLMLGGYAVRWDTTYESRKYDLRKYTTIDNFSLWSEIHTNGNKWQFGIFGGYSKNLGSTKNIQGYGLEEKYYYARGFNIAYLYRISPRISLRVDNFRIAFETEYTTAAYGKTLNSLGQVSDIKEIPNIRLLLGVYYYF